MPKSVIENVLDKLQSELRRAHPARVMQQENDPDLLRALLSEEIEKETKARKSIDEACLHWISSGAWPKMGSEHAILVWERLNEALLLLNFLHRKLDLPEGQKSKNDVLKIFLVDMWEVIGVHRLRSRLYSIL